MALLPLLDCRVWVNGHDLSGVSNTVNGSAMAADLDKTTFDSGGWSERLGGLKDATYETTAFFDPAADLDAALDSLKGASVIPTFGAEADAGSAAIFGRGLLLSHTHAASVGEIPTLAINMSGSHAASMVDGVILEAKRTETGNADGTGIELGAIGATEALYAALHVFAVTGTPVLTVKIQSDDNGSFTTPTDRITFTATSTAATAQWGSVAGAVTDTHWRAVWTVAAGDATFAVVAGIQ